MITDFEMNNEKNQDIKVINTLQFGELTIEQKHIFYFDDGMLGFDHLREFVLITEENTIPFRWLISLDEPEVGFPMLSPWHIDLTYEPGEEFNIENEVLLVVVTLEDEKGLMTANMKAPVVLNVVDQSGKQIILTSEKYSPTHIIRKK
jgi:flagellar assembly factor FliW